MLNKWTKVAVIPMCERVNLQSDRSTSYTYVYQDVKELETMGPYIESMSALTVTKNRTSNHEWKVVAVWSIDGVTANTPFTDVCGAISADAQAINTAITSGFGGRILKFALAVRNSSGAALESAIVSVWLVVVFKT